MKYWCFNCDLAVEPASVPHYEYHGEVDTRQYERWEERVCPCCREEVVMEADLCDCGNWKPESQVLCAACADRAREAYETALDYIQSGLSASVRAEAESIFLAYIDFYK